MNEAQMIASLKQKLQQQTQLQRAYDDLLNYSRNSNMNFELYMLKMKFEEKLNKQEQALKTCNFLLFLQPNSQELHINKLNLLKSLQQFKEISDQMLIIKQLFPQVNLMQI